MTIEVTTTCFVCDKRLGLPKMFIALKQAITNNPKFEAYFIETLIVNNDSFVQLINLLDGFNFVCSGECLANYPQKKFSTT